MPSEGTTMAAVIDVITSVIVATILLILVYGMYTWMKSQRNRKAMGDVDWEREKERLLLLASERKASRKADAAGKKHPDEKDESGSRR